MKNLRIFDFNFYKIIVIIFLLFYQTSVNCSSDINNDHSEKISEVKILLNEGSILRDILLITKAKSILESIPEPHNKYIQYYIAQSDFELVRLGIALETNELFDKHYDAAVNKIQFMKKKHNNWSELYALLASLYGFKIGRNWTNALILGPKGYFEAENAVKYDSLNPRAWLVRGMMKLNMPNIFGGSVEVAIEYFEKSIKLFELNKSEITLNPSWGYIDVIIWLGWAYQKKEDYENAYLNYQKALTIEPRAIWIKTMFLEPLKNIQLKGSN